MNVPAAWYLILAAVLFGVGSFGLLTRRSALIMFMCVELMLTHAQRHRGTGQRLFRDGGRRR